MTGTIIDESKILAMTPVELRPVALGTPPGHLARIGLIGLSTGMTCEEELHNMLPEGALVLTSRVVTKDKIELSNQREMKHELVRAANTLLPSSHLDAIAYSCTSGTIAIGEQAVMELIQSARPGVPVTTPFTGAIAALKRLAVERITFLTPYVEEVTSVMRTAIEDRGFQVVRTVSMDLSLDSEICRVAPATLAEVAAEIDTADSQALFISCTTLMTSPVIAGIEASIGKPVVTSNQALTWHALRLSGCNHSEPRYGRLMTLDL